MTHEEKARELFLQGFNCAQSVFAAFAEDMGFSEQQALKMACGFGGGLGGRREMCGAASAMVMVYGALRGYDEPNNTELKAKHYAEVRQLVEQFEAQFGTSSCRTLLGLDENVKIMEPSERTKAYYASRPCPKLAAAAAAILEAWLQQHPQAETETDFSEKADMQGGNT